MSYIVAALAKSRGQTAPTPQPEDAGALPPIPVEGAASFSLKPYGGPTAGTAKTFPWLLTLFGVVLLSAGAAGAWWLTLPTQPIASSPGQAPQKSAATASPAAAPAAADSPAAPAPSAALTEKVRTLPVSAAVAGASQKAVIAGKVYLPGDHVTDELVLQEVYPGLIVFRDAAGALYTRRF